ncbi:MAG TPA: DUF2244 domain-containing protein [Caulobacteraceae bacterium]|jgi:uncharacterized membrane protein|nr:DUF2244 domain-containing protein [Caulobacteraceae bacterium]
MAAPIFLDAEVRPHRSLSRRGRRWLLGVVVALNAATAAVFMAIGARLVLPFLGLDVVALSVALAVSARSDGAAERVLVSAAEVRVTRRARGREQLVWASPPAWTRCEFVDDARGPGTLRLSMSGRRLELGEALGRPERMALARDVQRALGEARRARSW